MRWGATRFKCLPPCHTSLDYQVLLLTVSFNSEKEKIPIWQNLHLGKENISCYNTNGIKHLLIYMTKFGEAHNCLMCSGSCLKQGRNWSADFVISVDMRALRQLLRWQQSLSCIIVSCEQNFPEYNNDVAMTTVFKEWYRQLNAEIADVHLKNVLEINFNISNPKYHYKFFTVFFWYHVSEL